MGKTPETNVNEETDCFPSGNFVQHLDNLEHTTSVDEIRASHPDSATLGQSPQETKSTKTEGGGCESRLSNMVSETSLDHSDESYLESNELSFSIQKGKELDKASSVESGDKTESSRVLNIEPGPNNSLLVSDESAVADLLTAPVETCDIVLRTNSDLPIHKLSPEMSTDVEEEKNYSKDCKDELCVPDADKICDANVQNSSCSDKDLGLGLDSSPSLKTKDSSSLNDISDNLLTAICNSNDNNNSLSLPQKSPPKNDSKIPELEDKASDLLTPNNNLSSNVDDVKLKEVLTHSYSDIDKLEGNADLENVGNTDIHKNLDDSKNSEKCGTNKENKNIENLEDQTPVIKNDSSIVCEQNSSGEDDTTTVESFSQKLTNEENIGIKQIEKSSVVNERGSLCNEQGQASDSEIQMKEDVKLQKQQLYGVIDSKIGMDDDFCSLETDSKCTIQKSSFTEKESSCMVTGDDILGNTESKVHDKSNTSMDSSDNFQIKSTPIEEGGETGPKLKDETNITTEQNNADKFKIEATPFQGDGEAETNLQVKSNLSMGQNDMANLKIESTPLKTNSLIFENQCSKASADVCVKIKKNTSPVSVDQSVKEMENEFNLIDEKEISSSEESYDEKYGLKEVDNHSGSELMQNKNPSVECDLPNNTYIDDKLCSDNDLQDSIPTLSDVDDVCLSHRLKSNSSQNDSFKLTKTGEQDISCKKMESMLFVKSVEDLNSSAISVNIFEERKKSVLDENISDLGICGVLSDSKQNSVKGIETESSLEASKVTSDIGNQEYSSNTPKVACKNELTLQVDENSESSDERATVIKNNLCENRNECESKLSSCDSRNSFTSSDLEMEASDCSSVPSQKAVSQGCATDMDQDIAESTTQATAGKENQHLGTACLILLVVE